MTKALRPLIITGLLALTCVALPSTVDAGVGASAAPEFPITIRLGDTDVPASIELRNGNSDDPDPADPDQDTGYTNTVCNEGDGFPCTPGERGITLVPTCGVIGAGTTCDPSGADPGVFELSSTATGAGACVGIDFDVTIIDAAVGLHQFTPTLGRNVTLPGTGANCLINFTFDVVGLPTVDVNPNVAGVQTAQIVSTDQIVEEASDNHVVPAQGNGTSVRQVLLAQPTIATTASPDTRLGAGALTDTAIVSGRFEPANTGSIDFRLYGPDDPTCSNTPVFESLAVAQPVADGPVTSAPYTPTATGTHRWIASYSGDANNLPVAGSCDEATEVTVVERALPTLVTQASADTTIDAASLSDTAVVTNRFAPAASTIDFRLYGPDDATCSNPPIFESLGVAYPIAGGPVTSESFTAPTPGIYRWVATYSGDDNNEGVVGTCDEADENTTVERGASALTATASPGITLGSGVLTDTAELVRSIATTSGGAVDFRLYGPDDATCSEPPVFESLGVAAATAAATSAPFTPTAAGTYRWVVSYPGDTMNAPVSGSCGEPNQTAVVAPAKPTVSITASPLIELGRGTVSSTVDLGDRVNPGVRATVRFRLYGPGDAECSGTPVFATEPIVYPVAGGPITSPQFTPTAAGAYRWTATYGDDPNNETTTTSCAEPSALVNVTAPLVTELPATGADTDVLLIAAALLTLLGVGLVGSTRRRSSPVLHRTQRIAAE